MTRLLQQDGVTLTQADNALILEGDLSMDVAAKVAATGKKWLEYEASSGVAFDFSDVQTATSVALSVLFEWLRACNEQALHVERITLSSPLMRLAALAELDELIDHPGRVLAR